MIKKPPYALPAKKENTEITLPEVEDFSAPMLSALTKSLGVSRDVLASDDQISDAWGRLPKQLKRIPPHLRDERMVRLCVAIASGLFDSAINYAWNSAVSELREKVRRFGISIVPQILDETDFDEEKLLELKDAELLSLCHKLNLISEDGFFLLNQCRDIRNNLSAAHPSIGNIDEDEVIVFLSRCVKHALSEDNNPVGVDIKKLIAALKSAKFSKEQREEWVERINLTFEAQRELIFGMLHGIYCDPDSGQEARLNALNLCRPYASKFSTKAKSELIDRHQDYKAKGDGKRLSASREFFRELEILGLLTDGEKHHVVSTACKKLMAVHNAYDNFHNEPPFAERLQSIADQGAIPVSAQSEFVETVMTCAVGNSYGISNAAMPDYMKMIASFTPQEVKIVINLPEKKCLLTNRITNSSSCRERYIEILSEIDPDSVLAVDKPKYEKWLSKPKKKAVV